MHQPAAWSGVLAISSAPGIRMEPASLRSGAASTTGIRMEPARLKPGCSTTGIRMTPACLRPEGVVDGQHTDDARMLADWAQDLAVWHYGWSLRACGLGQGGLDHRHKDGTRKLAARGRRRRPAYGWNPQACGPRPWLRAWLPIHPRRRSAWRQSPD